MARQPKRVTRIAATTLGPWIPFDDALTRFFPAEDIAFWRNYCSGKVYFTGPTFEEDARKAWVRMCGLRDDLVGALKSGDVTAQGFDSRVPGLRLIEPAEWRVMQLEIGVGSGAGKAHGEGVIVTITDLRLKPGTIHDLRAAERDLAARIVAAQRTQSLLSRSETIRGLGDCWRISERDAVRLWNRVPPDVRARSGRPKK